MTRDELVERVARAYSETAAHSSAEKAWEAAITIALEKAVKAVEEALTYHSCCCSFEAAAAIRGMMK
jgi:hypothetical protein